MDKQPFKITELTGADWAFEKIAELTEEERTKKEFAQQKIGKVNDWLSDELRRLEGRKEYYEGLLKEYFIEQRRKNPKFRLSVPNGRMNTRKSRKIVITDEKKAIEYFKTTNSNAIRVNHELDKKYINSTYKDGIDVNTGEILDFIKAYDVEEINIKSVES